MALTAGQPAWRVGFVLATAVASGSYLYIWWIGAVQMREVLAIAVVLRLLFIPLGPSLSDDTHRYIWDGLLQNEGINPYAYQPEDEALSAFHTLPIYEELNSKRYYTVYPPLSQLLFSIAGLVHDQGWIYSYYLIKLIVMAFELMGVFLLARLVTARSVLLYAWNPLVLVEIAGQAHTEGVMVFMLFLCLWGVERKKGNVAILALTGAVWIKLYPLVLFPFVLRRVGWMKAWVAGVASAVLLFPYYHPEALAHVSQSLDLYVRLFEFNAGPYYTVKWAFREATGKLGWGKTIGPAFRMIFLLALPVLYIIDWKRSWPLAKAILLTLGLYLVLATTIHPWYFLGILAMFPFLDRPPWPWLWLAMTLMGTYLFYTHRIIMPILFVAWGGWAVLGILNGLKQRATDAKMA
jgi:alpha-1,6-mannosyltransferase